MIVFLGFPSCGKMTISSLRRALIGFHVAPPCSHSMLDLSPMRPPCQPSNLPRYKGLASRTGLAKPHTRNDETNFDSQHPCCPADCRFAYPAAKPGSARSPETDAQSWIRAPVFAGSRETFIPACNSPESAPRHAPCSTPP